MHVVIYFDHQSCHFLAGNVKACAVNAAPHEGCKEINGETVCYCKTDGFESLCYKSRKHYYILDAMSQLRKPEYQTYPET